MISSTTWLLSCLQWLEPKSGAGNMIQISWMCGRNSPLHPRICINRKLQPRIKPRQSRFKFQLFHFWSNSLLIRRQWKMEWVLGYLPLLDGVPGSWLQDGSTPAIGNYLENELSLSCPLCLLVFQINKNFRKSTDNVRNSGNVFHTFKFVLPLCSPKHLSKLEKKWIS